MKISRGTLARMPELIEAYRAAGYGEPGAVQLSGAGACLNCVCPFTHTLIEDAQSAAVWGMVDALSRQWPKFSGDIKYPVPAPGDGFLGYVKEDAAQAAYENTTDVWVGEYGDLRREFCRYMANAVDEYCNGRLDDAEDTEH